MNLLFVAPICPCPLNSGGAVRIYNILERLGASHRIHLVIVSEEHVEVDRLAELESFCSRVVGFSLPNPYPRRFSSAWWAVNLASIREPLFRYRDREVQSYLDQLVAQEPFDAVLLETAKVAQYALAWRLPNIIVVRQNDELKLARRMLAIQSKDCTWVLGHLMRPFARRFERHLARRLPTIVSVSEPDARSFRDLNPDALVTVIPNGVDIERYQPSGLPETEGSVLFTGAMGYLPNRDAVEFFCTEIWEHIRPLCPNAKFRAMGSRAASFLRHLAGRPGVEIADHAEDQRPAIASAAVCVVPLRAGSGTRLKILEAMAMGKAIVSTSVGCEGIDVVPGTHLLIADTPTEFANHVVRLLRDADLRRLMGSRARKLVEEQYDWARIVRNLEDLMCQVAQRALRERSVVNRLAELAKAEDG